MKSKWKVIHPVLFSLTVKLQVNVFYQICCYCLVLKWCLFFFYLQTEIFKIIHSMLVSSESRDSCLSFIATALQRNHRKAQLQVSGNTNSVLRNTGIFPVIGCLCHTSHLSNPRTVKINLFVPFVSWEVHEALVYGSCFSKHFSGVLKNSCILYITEQCMRN